MSQCPVCNSHYRPGNIAHCAACGWNLAALPATLGQIPQAFQARDLEKLNWAQKTWTQLQTQSQQLSQLQQERSRLQAQLSQKAKKLTASPEILAQLRSQLKESAREKRQLQEQLASTVRLFRLQQQKLAAQLQKSKAQLIQSETDKTAQQTLSGQNFAISLSLNEQEAPAEVVVIHEFSTGIYGSRAADGTWQFHGLTGHYMNSTLELIPESVQQAISNGYFSIAGGSEEKPALVGRVINSAKDGFWSVLAVVTERKHSNGEIFSAYRYFLSQGKDKLVQILDWMNRYKQKFGLYPTFNPSDPKKPGQQQRFESQSRFILNFPSETQAWLDNVGTPLIVVEPIYTVEAIDRLATWLAERRRLVTQRPPQTEAWVYNADSVERIETFLVVQLANREKFPTLQGQLLGMRESLEQEVAQLEKQIGILQRQESLLTAQLNTANETATNLKAWTRDSQVAIASLNEQLERWQSVIAALLGAIVVAGLAIAVMGGGSLLLGLIGSQQILGVLGVNREGLGEIDRLLRLLGWAGLLSSAMLLLSIATVRRLGALLQHNSRLRQRFDPLIAKLLRYL